MCKRLRNKSYLDKVSVQGDYSFKILIQNENNKKSRIIAEFYSSQLIIMKNTAKLHWCYAALLCCTVIGWNESIFLDSHFFKLEFLYCFLIILLYRPSLAESSNGSSTMGEVPKEENANLEFPVPVEPPKQTKDPVSDDDKNKVVLSKNSGIFMYVDIHGHASKRGIFM